MPSDTVLLIAYDGSDTSRHALDRAGTLFPGARAVIATVWEPTPVLSAPGALGTIDPLDIESQERVDKAVNASARRTSDEGVEAARAAGLVAEGRVTEDAPTWHGIVALADEVDASVIVVGSRGHGGLRSALLGSVSQGVVHHAHRPVLVIRDDEHQPPKR
ncbi:MAG: universal stress protein [Solirubrobacteraceae bacterium]|nr:universal stress protein [Solirubrobacteraceae bacterium]